MNERGPELRNDRHFARRALADSFRRFFWLSYDHLGLLLLANLVWLGLSLGVVTAPAATAGLATLAARLAAGEDTSLRDLWAGFRRHFVPALKLGVFDAVAVIVLWVNVDFYSHLGGRASLPGFLLAGALLWVTAFWLLLHVHALPLLVAGERRLHRILRDAALLTLDNLRLSIGTALQAFMLSALALLTGIGVIAILVPLLSLLQATAHRQLLRKYRDDLPEDPPERRTWRHLWRPWEASGRS